MATSKFLDADGVKIFWDKCNATFLPKDTAANSAVKLQNARNFKITDGENFGNEINFDGSADVTLNLPKKIKAEIDGNAKTATTLDTPRTIQANLQSSDAVNFDGSENIKIGVTGILPEEKGGTGKNNLDDVITGKAKKAIILESARKIQIDLSSTTAANFNGSVDINPGVKGILEVANGGTGNSVGNAISATKLLNPRTLTIQDYLAVNTGKTATFDGTENILLKLPETIQGNLTGNATTSTKAEQDFDGNIISKTYAKIENPELKGTPQAPTAEPNNDSKQIATTAFVAEAIRRLVGTSPATLDTLSEIAAAINQDENFATTIANELSKKQNKNDALTSISNLQTSADKMIFTTAQNVFDTATLTEFARTLLDDTDATTARNTLNALGKNENAISATIAENCSGNSKTASKLETAKNITISDDENFGTAVSFDGSENIILNLPNKIKAEIDGNSKTADKLKNARNFKITDGENFGNEINFDGSENATLNLPNKIKAEIDGNSATTSKFQTPRSIQTNLEKDSATNFDGTENIKIGVTGILPMEHGGTGKNNLNEVTVGAAIQATKDSKGNIISEKYLPKFEKFSITIPSSDWLINSDHDNYNYCQILEIENITPDDVVNINLIPESHGIAITCGLCATIEISNGFITLFSKTLPTEEIFGEYYILKGAATGKNLGYGAINTSTSQREIIYVTPEQDGTLTYTGGELRPIWKNYDPTKLLISGETSGIDAKTYAVNFTPIGNCTWSDDTRTPRRQIWKINKGVIQIPEQIETLIYNGEIQTPNLKNYDENKMTLSGDISKTDAGIYIAYATPKENFKFEDDADKKIFSWLIEKAPLEFSIDKNSLSLGNANITEEILINRSGDGIISAISADSSVATVTLDENKIKVTAVATGHTEIIIQFAEGTNYFSDGTIVEVETSIIKPLNQCTPIEILDAVKSEKAVDAWKIGDKTASIILNGDIGAALTLNNFEICARIIGFNHNSQLETGGKSSVHFALDLTVDGKNVALCDSNFDSASASGVEYFQHNLKNGTNTGGWTESNIRTKILADIFNALPQDWQEIISVCTKYTGNNATQDKMFLLSEFEIFGRQDYADDTEQNFQAQYDYFKAGNDTIHYKHNETSTPCYWWLRTPQANNDTSFCRVDVSGDENTYNALYSLGVVPCFVVW